MRNSFHTEVSGLSDASNSGTCSTGSIKSHIFFHGTWVVFWKEKFNIRNVKCLFRKVVWKSYFKISDEKKRYLERLIAFMNYEKPSVSKETLMIDDIGKNSDN